VVPGDGVTDPVLRLSMERLWRDAGGFIAGCAERASKEVGRPVFSMLGHCGRSLRAIEVGVSGLQPMLFAFDAAERVYGLVRHDKLLGVSASAAGDGEIIVLQSLDGTHALLRTHTVRSGSTPNSVLYSCHDYRNVGEAFNYLPPAAVDLLRQSGVRRGWGWPELSSSADGVRVWRLVDADGRVHDKIVCDAADRCRLADAGTHGADQAFVPLESLTELAPPKPEAVVTHP